MNMHENELVMTNTHEDELEKDERVIAIARTYKSIQWK